ncbi:MAG: SMP-30/gluconolactonase/LRE family protein [Pirellulales bacterium]
MSLLSLKDVSILAEGLDHPECVAWGPDGNLYAGGEAGQIYRISLDGEVTEIASTGGFVQGICLDGNGIIYACDFKKQVVLRIDRDARVSVYSDGTADRKMRVPNYPVFDRAGRLYVSDSGGWHDNNGCLFVVTPDGQTRVVNTRVAAFPNGLALSPDGSHLYLVLSNLPGVVKLPVAIDGSVGSPQPVVELPRTVPDGLAFDRDGGLYISCYTPDLIYRLSPDGKLEVLIEDEERTLITSPTNITFAGADLSTLVASNFGGWHLTQMQAPVAGSPLHYPFFR